MSAKPLRHPLLSACGVEHGFGVRGTVAPPGTVLPQQVHGVEVARPSGGGRCIPETADAIVGLRPAQPVAVVTADCVPVLAALQDGSAVVAIHAGWRGLAAGVMETGMQALRSCGADDVPAVAAIGPHIGRCCYEVDAPVLEALDTRFGDVLGRAISPSRAGHHWLDLGLLVAVDLARVGVPESRQGQLADACTCCDAARFESYRRDGARAGRLVHYIAARHDEGTGGNA